MRPLLLVLTGTLLPLCLPAMAETQFDKSYPITGRPALQVEVDNASVEVRSCRECNSVHVHIDTRDEEMSQFRLEEDASGNTVHVRLKHVSGHFTFRHNSQPRITIEVPREADAYIDTGNGDLKLADLSGDLRMHTGNGNGELQRLTGTLRIETGNGDLTVREGAGTLNLSSGNGTVRAEGRFTEIQAHSGNGKVEVELASGARLTAGSRLTSGNGEVSLRLPRDLRADLELKTGSGNIHCGLPLTSSDTSSHTRSGTLNGGGPHIEVQTGSGDIRIDAL